MPPFILGNVLQPLIDLTEAVLKFFHDEVGLGWGLSIIALTVCVRAVLVPLTVKQLKSMREMQRIAPEMKALQAKYKDDKPRLQQEMMALYKEHQVNPFGSCLPLLAQLPVFIALFYMLQKDLRMEICGQTAKACGAVGQPEKFLFVSDITDKATGATLAALIVLYVGSQLLSTIFMTATADKTQRMLMMGLPFVFTIFVINFPAGLLVYWITTNFWTVGQGIIVRRTMPPLTPPAPAGGPKAPASAAAVAPPRKKRGRVGATEPAADDAAPAEKPAPKPRSGPPPSARRKKKRAGRRR